MKGSYNKKNKK